MEIDLDQFAARVLTKIDHLDSWQKAMNSILQIICFSVPVEQKIQISQQLREQQAAIQMGATKSDYERERNLVLIGLLADFEKILTSGKAKPAAH